MTAWDRISILMTRHSVSKRELASICKVRPSAVTKWVNRGGIDADKIAHMAIHFGVTTDWILGVSEHSNNSSMNYLTSSHPPIKKVKISKLREDTAAVKVALETLVKAVSGLEKRLGELDGE